MAEKSIKPNLKSQSKTNKNKTKLDVETLYEQIMKGNSVLEANKYFWTKKGNSKKYFCILCNIGIQVSSNLPAFKSAILNHIEDKHHQKKYMAHIAKESLGACAVETGKEVENSNNNLYNEQQDEDYVQEYEDYLWCDEPECDEYNKNTVIGNCLVDFNRIYLTLEKSNPVVRGSKRFIKKTEDEKHFFCTLCNVLIKNSLNAYEYRYNLWVHLNEETHRKKLPNFSEVQKDFKLVMKKLFRAIPPNLKDDIQFFEIGPVFRYVRCSLCDVAVSTNLHRLENHLKGKGHQMKKLSMTDNKQTQPGPVSYHIQVSFKRLLVQLEDQFKNDIKYLRTGNLPGYVVCSLCVYVILPTKYYTEYHLASKVHKQFKKTSLVNDKSKIKNSPPDDALLSVNHSKKSKFKMTLRNLVNSLPKDFDDTFLEENIWADMYK